MNGMPTLDARSARRMAGTVLKHLLGKAPRRVVPLTGGLSNFVFEAAHPDGALVVRLSPDPGKIKGYLKEQWAMAQAREEGVPVAEVLEIGTTPIPFPFMVLRKVAGNEATHHPDRFAVLHEMGRLARLIHGIRTSGFGNTFDWSGNQLSRKESWADYLAREYQGEDRLALLQRLDMLPARSVKALRATWREVMRWEPDPVLNHGDLRLKNVVVGKDGKVGALLDWELSQSHAAPYWDLSIALHDLSVDAKEAFLEGYGMAPKAVMEAAPVLRLFNLLNYSAAIERAERERDRKTLARLRARLHGALDLHAF